MKRTSSTNSTKRLTRRELLTLGALTIGGTVIKQASAAGPRRRVVVWSEGTAPVDEVYPDDINTALAIGLRRLLPDWRVDTAGIDSPEQGCSVDSLERCDVMIWWGHKRHGEVKDEYVDRIERRVKQDGMGFISVHSAHFAKTNKRLMGTRCGWAAYKTDGCQLKVRVRDGQHPIAAGVSSFTLPRIERYSEPYQVPTPEAVPLEGVYVYPNGKEEETRVGLCWKVGKGRLFYFAPGHETYPNLYRPMVQRIFANAVEWAAPSR